MHFLIQYFSLGFRKPLKINNITIMCACSLVKSQRSLIPVSSFLLTNILHKTELFIWCKYQRQIGICFALQSRFTVVSDHYKSCLKFTYLCALYSQELLCYFTVQLDWAIDLNNRLNI